MCSVGFSYRIIRKSVLHVFPNMMHFRSANSSLSFVTSRNDEEQIAAIRYVTYCVILPITISIGVLLNSVGFTVIVTSGTKTLSATHICMCCLALSNLIGMISIIPWLIHVTYPGCRPYPEMWYSAHLELPSFNSVETFSIYILVWMSIERYCCVCRPAFFHRIHRSSVVKVVLAICFVVASLIQMPLSVSEIVVRDDSLNCTEWSTAENHQVTHSIYWTVYTWTNESLSRLMPCVALTILNLKMIFKYRRIMIKRSKMTSTNCAVHVMTAKGMDVSTKKVPSIVHQHENNRLLILLSLMVVLFVVCLVPAGMLLMLKYWVDEDTVQYEIFRSVANILENLNLAVILFIILLCSSDLQLRLKRIIMCVVKE